MTVAVLRCAQRFVADVRDAGDLERAEDVARSVVANFPEDIGLWELGAEVLCAKGEKGELERWLRDAAHHLDVTDIDRIRRGLTAEPGAHDTGRHGAGQS